MTYMNEAHLVTLAQVQQFLDGTEAVTFTMATKPERYSWIQHTLVRFRYLELSKAEKGVLMRYLAKVSGYSRQQLTRLISQYRASCVIRSVPRPANGFRCRYTREDIALLAELDELHGTLSGPATKKLCERAYEVFKQPEYQRLAGISVAHLYNLRKSTTYRRKRYTVTKTCPTPCSIGERRQPQPQGQPGYIRIDTVHQGDLDQQKGVYHINAVDEVTQFELISSVERISEAYLIPALTYLLATFPFVIHGFHSDNGSEYVNKQVAKLLNKLLIEFTKSRARQSNDNALVESKNGAVVRKHLGYAHIPQRHAQRLNAFHHHHLNPYLNFHRPCFFPVTVTDANGKQRKTYPYKQMMTPYEKLKSLPDAARYLKPEVSFAQVDEIAYQISDNEAARQLQQARKRLFQTITEQDSRAA